MLRDKGYLIGNYAIFLFATLVFLGAQTTLWTLTLGELPPPNFWIPTLVYWAVYRSMKEGVYMTFLLSMALAPFTVLSFGLILLIHLILYFALVTFRQRIFGPGPIYFMLVSAAISLAFPVVHLLVSHVIEKNPIVDFLFMEWLFRGVLTALVSLPIFVLFSWFDIFTQKNLPSDARSEYV